MFNNKTILVTVGTGSFGVAFIEGIYSKYKPKKSVHFFFGQSLFLFVIPYTSKLL